MDHEQAQTSSNWKRRKVEAKVKSTDVLTHQEPPSIAAFKQIEDHARPVKLLGCFDDWPALTRWASRDPAHVGDFLTSGQRSTELEQVAGASVSVLVSSTSDFQGSAHKTATLCVDAKTLTQIANGRSSVLKAIPLECKTSDLHCYLCQCSILVDRPTSRLNSPHNLSVWPTPRFNGELPHLADDIACLPFLKTHSLSAVNVWMSLIGTTDSNLHYDDQSNVLCVVQGQKSVTLFPPSCTSLLRPNPITSVAANHSQLSLSETLAVRCQERCEVQLGAGEALFIPHGWWHQVSSTEHCIAVNFWWDVPATDPVPLSFMRPFYVRALLHDMLSDAKNSIRGQYRVDTVPDTLMQKLTSPEQLCVDSGGLHCLRTALVSVTKDQALSAVRSTAFIQHLWSAMDGTTAVLLIDQMELFEETMPPLIYEEYSEAILGTGATRHSRVEFLLHLKSTFADECLRRQLCSLGCMPSEPE